MNGMIGNISKEEFNRLNEQGNQAVAAIEPTSGDLSSSDLQLLELIALGGTMQLKVSEAADGELGSEDARLLAESEVEEQTGVSAKLEEIASAKGVSLPTGTDPETQDLLDRMDELSGAELDAFYLLESGVNGHEKLFETMTEVQSSASDPDLVRLATATLPVIQMHMEVSRAVLDQLSGTDLSSAAGI